jgi:glycosyltransferase involved in cell wall biosynthesis
MKVTAVIPTYNYAAYVGAAIDSVLGQDFEGDIECIVVDDGSTDDTPRVVARYGNRVRYLRQENRGMAAAINAGHDAAGGDVLCLLDADDVWKPEKVRLVVDAFGQVPAAGLVHHEVLAVDGVGWPIPDFLRCSRRAHGDVSHRMRLKVLPWMFNPTSSLSLRRSVCHHLFPLVVTLRGNADDLIAASAALLGPVIHIPEVLSLYRVHGRNLWALTKLGKQRGPGLAGRGPWEDVDEYAEPQRYVRLLDEKVRQANLTLERAGLPGGLSPFLNWNYLKYRSQINGVSVFTFWREVLRAATGVRGLRLVERASLVRSLFRRMIHHNARGRRGTTAGQDTAAR